MHILLDFDGVVLRKHNAFQEVQNRCVSFVHKTTKVKNPYALNTFLYKRHGHTLHGLRKQGYNCTIQQFNSYVYDIFPYKKYFHDLKDSHASDISHLKDLVSEYDVKILSNAPPFWCKTILEYMDVTPLEIIDTHNVLKPNPRVYRMVEYKYPHHHLFVDDSIDNLEPIRLSKKWSCVHFTDTMNLTDIVDPKYKI